VSIGAKGKQSISRIIGTVAECLIVGCMMLLVKEIDVIREMRT
jgi:hypothetical protein